MYNTAWKTAQNGDNVVDLGSEWDRLSPMSFRDGAPPVVDAFGIALTGNTSCSGATVLAGDRRRKPVVVIVVAYWRSIHWGAGAAGIIGSAAPSNVCS